MTPNRLNTTRILSGGVIAGLIMNISEAALHAGVLRSDAEQLYKALNVPPPNPAANLPVLIAAAFLVGFVSMWLYAAIRPRFGAGAKTASNRRSDSVASFACLVGCLSR